jgi:NADPH-dependent ferric siderophore reductase
MDSLTRESLRVRHPLRLRLAQVTAVEAISPRMRRITLGGEELKGFASAAADDHVKLFLPDRGQDRPVLPSLGPNGPVFSDGAARPVMRDFTPRRFDPNAGELTIEFVLHGHGPASAWAEQARPGQWIGVGGPRGSLIIPDGYDAYLLIGDESALPAIARRLEEMAPGAVAFALIEVSDRREERHLPTAANARIDWLCRNGADVGEPAALVNGLQALELPSGDVHAWIAAEIDVARRLRRFLIDERGLPRSQIRAAGYWRKGEAGAHARIED